MSFDALLSGKIGRGGVTLKTAANGRQFARWLFQVTDKNGNSLLASCVAFRDSVIEPMQAMGEGDSVAVSGECAISQWQGNDGQGRVGLDVVAHAVLTAYAVQRKRKAAQGEEAQPQADRKPSFDAARAFAPGPGPGTDDGFADDLGFLGGE